MAPWRHSWLLRIKVVALFLVVSIFLVGSLPSANAGSSRFLLARTRGEAGRRSLHANLQCGRGTAPDFGCKAYFPLYRNATCCSNSISGGSECCDVGGFADDKCGSCNSKCAYGLKCCSGVCVNKQSDSANCGWCGNTCKYNLPCRNGLCGYGE